MFKGNAKDLEMNKKKKKKGINKNQYYKISLKNII